MVRLYEPDLQKILTTIEIDHQRVHQGQFFISTIDWPEVGTANKTVFLNPEKGTHLRGIQAETNSGELQLKLWEGVNVTDSGNTVSSVNLNRYSSVTSPLSISSDSVFDEMGQELFSISIMGDKKTPAIGEQFFSEIILNNSNTYAMTVNTVTSAGNVHLLLTYYDAQD